MKSLSTSRLPSVVFRWLFGMTLVSWRYLWQTTPLHRQNLTDDTSRPPPDLPPAVDRQDLQLIDDGVGSMFHRLFCVEIAGARLDAAKLMARILADLSGHVPQEVVHIRPTTPAGPSLKQNQDFVVDMPGPWNGPVRVTHADSRRLHLVTRAGHLEAGQIEIRAHDDGSDIVFEIESWARPNSRLVHLLYSRLRLAKEIQLNMWVRFCKAAVKSSGGRAIDGISITTYRAPAPGDTPWAPTA